MTNYLNYFLLLAFLFQFFLIFLLIRQQHRPEGLSLFIYVNILFLIDILATVFLINSRSSDFALAAARVRLIARIFFPVIIYYFSRYYPLKPGGNRITLRDSLIFIPALALSIGSLFPAMVQKVPPPAGIYGVVYGNLYWVYFLFFGLMGYLIFTDFLKKFRLSRQSEETQNFRLLLAVLFPAAAFCLFLIQFSGFLGFSHPEFFGLYFLLSALLLYGALLFQLVGLSERNQHFFTSLSALAIGIFVPLLFIRETIPATLVWVSFPASLIIILLNYFSYNHFTRIAHNLSDRSQKALNVKFENFATEVYQFLDTDQMWAYVAEFCKEILVTQRLAFISLHFDVRPYQIEYIEGLEEENLKSILNSSSSLLMEALGESRGVIARSDYPANSLLYKTLADLQLSWAIPLKRRKKIIGIILAGGRKMPYQAVQYYKDLLKIMATQIAVALENIRNINEIIQSQKMAELGRFSSQIAHDFQSFITLTKLENPENARLRRHAEYMEKMVQDLLNYTRPQAIRPSVVNINNLLDMSLDLVEIPPNILIEKHYSISLPNINVDVGQMRRVFFNLFENSIRAMAGNQSGGRLKITTRPLRSLSRFQRSPWIYIELLDDGEGIPEEFLGRIFDPFFTTHKENGGNGMGLAIVKQIITRHHGFIDVTSMPGKGTVFNIRLPYIIEEPQTNESSKQQNFNR